MQGFSKVLQNRVKECRGSVSDCPAVPHIPGSLQRRARRGAREGVAPCTDCLLPDYFFEVTQFISRPAPGAPGLDARWTSSAKSGIGTMIGKRGRIWFTLSHGILNEIYYPRVDQACTRDMGLIVTGPDGYFSEEKRHTRQEVTTLDGIPAWRLVNTALDGRYRITKLIITDPHREVVLQRIRFEVLEGELGDYRLFALLAPHLRNAGNDNTAVVEDFKGFSLLCARKPGTALAMACSNPWIARSVGYVGTSDGWQQLRAHGRLVDEWTIAENGNVAITGEIPLRDEEPFVVAIGFGRSTSEAGHRVAASLYDGFESAQHVYCAGWRDWQNSLTAPELPVDGGRDLFRSSTAVVMCHESSRFPGGIIASLSIPWGASKGDGDLGGYHLAWPRDLAMSAGALLAARAHGDLNRVLRYLRVTQEAQGHWPQNMWLDGLAYWPGIQMDQASLPILLVDLAWRHKALDQRHLADLWPMVRRAAAFLVRHGPATEQDRWEENSGYTPFTMAVEIAALLITAELADTFEPAIAEYLRETADAWNEAIDRWTYVTDTPLSRQHGVDGYYIRIAPSDSGDRMLTIRNRPASASREPADSIVSPDALALVRFGIRAANDPRILNTIKVIDALLKVDLPEGPCWYRYNGDGYGEHADGSPFDGTGIGRVWPLLTGERAHYELAAGNREHAVALLRTLAGFANDGGFLPEQTWDTTDIPVRALYRGRPAGSAMPLCWAHAEYLKLRRSLADGRVFDTPPQTVQRYQVDRRRSSFHVWRFEDRNGNLPSGRRLRIETRAAATVHWSTNGWSSVSHTRTHDTGLGMHLADLDTSGLQSGQRILFTFHWNDSDSWEGTDFIVVVVPATPDAGAA